MTIPSVIVQCVLRAGTGAIDTQRDNTSQTTYSRSHTQHSLFNSFSIYTHRLTPNRIIDCSQLRHLRCACEQTHATVVSHVTPLYDIAVAAAMMALRSAHIETISEFQ